MNTLQKSLIGMSLIVLLAGCSQGANTKPSTSESPAAVSTERHTGGQASPPRETTDSEILSTVDVRLANGEVVLSTSRLHSGHLEFNVRNDSSEPLNMAVVRTELEPTEIVIKEGHIDKTQTGVEVLSEVRDGPIQPGQEKTLLETLEPGEYKLVVTSPNQSQPIAYSVLMVEPK